MDIESAHKNLFSPDDSTVTQSLQVLGSEGTLSDLSSMLVLLKCTKRFSEEGHLGIYHAVDQENLIACFNDLGINVRQKLGKIVQSLDSPVVDELGKDIFCENERRRLRAVQILGLLENNPRIKSILVKLIHDIDEKIRATAIIILGKITAQNDHDILLSLLSDNDKRVRANTIEALEITGNKRLIPILLRFRKDPVNRIRGNTLKALYNLGYTGIEQDLMEMLKDKDEFMRASALWVVTQIKLSKPDFEDISASYLLAESSMLRSNALKALKTLNTPRSIGYLKYMALPKEVFLPEN